jgi:hypothetical protein
MCDTPAVTSNKRLLLSPKKRYALVHGRAAQQNRRDVRQPPLRVGGLGGAAIGGGMFRRLWDGLFPRRDNTLDDEFAWLNPPSDPRDVAAWDQYWLEQTAHGLGPSMFDIFCDDRTLVTALRRASMSTILCAGNGVSMEPRVLAAAGFQVTALDSSVHALEVAQGFSPSNELLFRAIDPEMLSERGSVTFLVGDVFDSALAPGPFDLIIERRSAQAYQVEGRNEFLDALAERLSEQGVLFSQAHDGAWRPGEERRHLTESWFNTRGWASWRGEGPKPPGRVGWTYLTTG